MASLMMDRGDSYHVIYLGSCMMAHMATGLGVLQKPLRDLYFKYRQAGGGPAAQERYITMSPRGMTMMYKDSSSAQPTELFYSMPSILFWDAVQFITVKGSGGDKKVRGAFEPLDNDHSRNKDNLFSVMEKRFHFLQQMTHPPLFTCVLRRTSGVKALDVHAFVCSSDEEALSLVRALDTVQEHYKSDEVHETGVFGYKPFGGGDSGPVDSLRRNGGGGSIDRAGLGLGGPRVLPSAGMGLGQLVHSLGGREPGMAAPHKSQSALALSAHQQHLLSPSQADHPRQHEGVAGSPRVYQLTQQDFQPTRRELDNQLGHSEDDLDNNDEEEDDTYAYLTHIDSKRQAKTPTPPPRNIGVVGAQQRDIKGAYPGSLGQRGGSHHHHRHQEDLARNQRASSYLAQDWDSSGSLSSSPGTGSFNRPQPKPRASVAARQSKLGQGYSLLSGSGAAVPGQEDHGRASAGERDGVATPPRPRPRSPRYPSGGDQAPDGSRRNLYKDYEDNRDNNSPRQAPVRPRVLSQSTQDLRSPEREAIRGLGSPFDSPRRGFGREEFPPSRGSPTKNTPEPPPRPVAKVPPHKVTGVKVLPTGPVMPKKSSPDSPSPGDRPKSSLPGADDRMYASPQRKAKSHYFDEHNFRDGHTAEKAKNGKYKDNWQFKPTDQGPEYDYKTMSPEERAAAGNTGNMGEKLLLSKKKDAEIASVMQDLRFEYDGRTMSPGMPAGNNFEKSLGYFP